MSQVCQSCGVVLHEGPTSKDDERYQSRLCGGEECDRSIAASMRWFPILHHEHVPSDCPQRVPFLIVESHEDQAQRNHDQSLAELARRGGLDPVELWLVTHNLPLYDHDAIPTMARATSWVKCIATRWA